MDEGGLWRGGAGSRTGRGAGNRQGRSRTGRAAGSGQGRPGRWGLRARTDVAEARRRPSTDNAAPWVTGRIGGDRAGERTSEGRCWGAGYWRRAYHYAYIGIVVRPAPIPGTPAPALTGPLACPVAPDPPGHPRRRIIGRRPPSSLGDVGPSPEAPSARPSLPAPCCSACPAPPLPVPCSSACPAPRTSPPQPSLVHTAAPAPQQRSCHGCNEAMQIPGIIHRSDLRTVGIDEAARRRFLRHGLMQRVDSWYVRSTAPGQVPGSGVAILR